jgi:phosphohistidine phosphatase
MLYLLRHGDAEHESGEKGERQSRAAGAALAALGENLDACLTSPKVRALDTARLACESLPGLEPEIVEELAGGELDALALAAGRGDVLLVGHEPDFSNEVARLTGAAVKLRKGGLAILEPSTLHALLRPRDLKQISGRR